MAASSSYGTYLMIKATYDDSKKTWTAGSTYTKLVDIKDYPDLGGEPEVIETTTLSDKQQTNILGVEAMDTLTFTANYDKASMTKLEALENGEWDLAVWFTTKGLSEVPAELDADEGAFNFKGQVRAYPLGKGVNEVREIQISISNSTPITFA